MTDPILTDIPDGEEPPDAETEEEEAPRPDTGPEPTEEAEAETAAGTEPE